MEIDARLASCRCRATFEVLTNAVVRADVAHGSVMIWHSLSRSSALAAVGVCVVEPHHGGALALSQRRRPKGALYALCHLLQYFVFSEVAAESGALSARRRSHAAS